MVFSTSIPSGHTEGVFTKQLPIWNNLWWYWVSPLSRLDNSHYQVWCIWLLTPGKWVRTLPDWFTFTLTPITSLDWKHQCRLWKVRCDVCTGCHGAYMINMSRDQDALMTFCSMTPGSKLPERFILPLTVSSLDSKPQCRLWKVRCTACTGCHGAYIMDTH